jgi:cyclophilin family peptidyl-prolyl cis-trans isomerase
LFSVYSSPSTRSRAAMLNGVNNFCPSMYSVHVGSPRCSILYTQGRYAFVTILIVVALLTLAACDSPSEPAVSDAETPSTPALALPEEEAEPDATPVPGEDDPDPVPPPVEYASGSASELPPAERDGLYSEPPPMTIDPSRHYYATLKTEQGDIRVQLFADRAPVTVNNFIFLANEGFYNDTTFHRVLDGFMAQAGDPTGTGAGGPGYDFEDEIHPGMVFDQAGLLAMANRGPNTNGSQFFITFGPADWLDWRHTIFGKIIEGEDVLGRISLRDPATQPNTPGDTLYTVMIEDSDVSILPTPTPMPPTPTPTPTPTPFAPTALNLDARPLADLSPTDRVNYFNQPPEMRIDLDAAYTATITTPKGNLVVALDAQNYPLAVNNFVVLARLGFYDNTPISLIRPDDSIIFGVPDNNPLNDAGYKFAAEMGVGAEPDIGSMAYIPFELLDDGTTLSSSSQILIALIRPSPQFNEQLSFFGQIVEGIELLNQLTMEDTIDTIVINEAPSADASDDNGTEAEADLDPNDDSSGEPTDEE